MVSGGNTLLGLVVLFMNYRAHSQKSILAGLRVLVVLVVLKINVVEV